MKFPWGGPFNGQRYRQRILFDILYHFPIKSIVETGTFYGSTTALFAVTALPIYTVEINPRYFAYARVRFLFNRDNIHFYRGDSRTFLQTLARDTSVPKTDVFFYLDAHWEEELPLRDELGIIFSGWGNPIVMIDDFRVPKSDYEFDDYGPGERLDLEYIKQVVNAYELSVFFPAVSASAETGGKRGCAVLCRRQSAGEMMEKVRTLVGQESLSEDIPGD
ncbi:MAG: hypothetical protein P9M08_07465 [Candidatus Erginobacter occultus]|nr:hypothetical protein [Candidatus Erginobacter occultus]